MEFEHLVFKREAEEGEEKKEVSVEDIFSHISKFSTITSLFSSTEYHQESWAWNWKGCQSGSRENSYETMVSMNI